MSKAVDLKAKVDPITRETTFEMLGASYRLNFGVDALYQFYLLYRINPAIEPVGTDPYKILALLLVGLLYHQPDIDHETVKSWFSEGSMVRALSELAFSALYATMPDPEPEAVAPDPQGA